MAKAWEEDFWFRTAIMNSVLGLHVIFKWLFSSWFPLPIIAAVAGDLFLLLDEFSKTYRHQNYFKNKPKILQAILLELILVTLSETIFFQLGYKTWVAPFALLVYMMPAVVAEYRKPCPIPALLPQVPAGYNPMLYVIGVAWAYWYGKDEEDHNFSQVIIGLQLVAQSRHLFAYHLFMEIDRHMQNAEYYRWLLGEIPRGAVGRNEMLVGLFRIRGVAVQGCSMVLID